MKERSLIWIALLAMAIDVATSSGKTYFQNQDDDFDFESVDDYGTGARHANDRSKKFLFSSLPRSAVMNFNDQQQISNTTTECVTPLPTDDDEEPTPPEVEITIATSEPDENLTPTSPSSTLQPEDTHQSTVSSVEQETKAKELRNLVQHLYIAQARVQLEASEIKKAQAIANTAQQALEEAANHVRAITASLQSSQQEVAAAAIRAQTAQLQLAAHDQLLFAARQDVDALSSQMVGLQAAEGISQPKITVDMSGLLEKLRQPLQESDKPTPVPPIVTMPTQPKSRQIFQQRRYQHRHLEPGFRELYFG